MNTASARARAADTVLRGYKRWISPLFGRSCRFSPTCSEYAAQAVAEHGCLKGGSLAVWRLLRCNPLARAGYDPVPVCAHRTELPSCVTRK